MTAKTPNFSFGSLFSGIGGVDLGLERAGMRCKWQVEIDPWCQKILQKHWPNVPKYGDIREVNGSFLSQVDLIVGGFPCQDLSLAGKGVGIGGKRSGLWREFYRIICELRPRYVLVENVPALLSRGLNIVLGNLAAIGYDAEWEVLSACAFGAPHTRERLFILAYPQSLKSGTGLCGSREEGAKYASRSIFANGGSGVAIREMAEITGRISTCPACGEDWCNWHNSHREDCGCSDPWDESEDPDFNWWAAEPKMDRVAYGVPNRLDRIRGLGNAVVPVVAEFIGRRILKADECSGIEGEE